ncbi:17-beta-hydroxysteroid dehydrogenase type 6-like [Mytilus galloprovincialis]|uniref:17-beta-hydroxysteroid dehydrogenase type 6-like n=1 Tax=Mytilus galloprovincialis TaxID=29158 RepID=UPI003F7B53D7
MYTKLGYALLVVSFLLWKLDIGILWSGLCFIGACILLLPEKGRYVSSANKIVIITGCDSGFGNKLARRLDAKGFIVFAGCLAPDREGARELKESCSDRLNIVHLDVTDDWKVRGMIAEVKKKMNGNVLWAVVNNAGIAVFQEIEWCAVEQFQQLLDVNVLGVVRVTKATLPLLRQGGGRVINVASLAGRFTVPAFAAYSMSKKACIAFSDGLRQEMAKFGVRVITVEPGLYKTPIASEEYLITQNRKSWAETPSEIKDVYGEEYFESFLDTISKQMKRARSNVEEVIDQMVEAVTREDPKCRYVPHWLTYIRATILMYLPQSVTDAFFRKTYKVVGPVHGKTQ